MSMPATNEIRAPSGVAALLRALLLPATAATVGSIATASSVNTWYRTLDKPGFTPPGWVFGPVWTTLYTLMGVADHLVARQGQGKEVRRARALYRAQLALNALWNVLFFGMRSPLAGLIEIVLLWLAILMTILAFARVSRTATLLLIPYLLWTGFAALLNGAIWRRNR